MGLLVLFSATLLLAHGVQSCTIVELDSSGFAENAHSLLHALPMFFRRNGTFFLDNSRFSFKCSEHGGWHEFFSGEENIVPWSRQKETMHGEDCARYTRHEVDQLLHTVVQTKPDLLGFHWHQEGEPLYSIPCTNSCICALGSLSWSMQCMPNLAAHTTREALSIAYGICPDNGRSHAGMEVSALGPGICGSTAEGHGEAWEAHNRFSRTWRQPNTP